VRIAASPACGILKNAGIDRTAADRAHLVTVPALWRRGDAGAAFFTADLLDGTQAYVLAVIEDASRRIRILGVTLYPIGQWAAQQARDLGEQAHRAMFMIRDRGSNYTAVFDAVLADAGIRTVLCNVQTPPMNAIAERWIGGCRRELLDRTLIWNQAHLRWILREYETHHNRHRPHRSLYSAAPLIPLPEPAGFGQCRVRKQARASGMISEYRLAAGRGRGSPHRCEHIGCCRPSRNGARRPADLRR
jgi:putative transposase